MVPLKKGVHMRLIFRNNPDQLLGQKERKYQHDDNQKHV